AKTKMEDFVARRTKTAESKIALAEAQALADVRAAAADAAVQAASTILSQSVKGSVADDLLTKGIADVRQKLN
ncbi:MAG: ATP F0F1 synthase subunit B, partial [Bradyrhizobium sp.]